MVGKTSLVNRFINYNPGEDDKFTITCENPKSYINIDGCDYEVEILDTVGEEDFQNMKDMWIAFGDGFLLVFALNDYESFKYIKNDYDSIIKGKHGNKCPILLVGNKKDLDKERKVSYEEAKRQADEWNIGYIETSAINNLNSKEVFEKLAQDIIKYTEINKQRSKCCLIY